MNVTFKWIGGATFVLFIDNVKIAIDPVLCAKGTVQDYFWFKSKRIEDPNYESKDFENIDIWLITHNHEDHIDDIGLSMISPSSQIISNNNSIKKLRKQGLENIKTLSWNESKNIKLKDIELNIQAIPAIHGVNPLSAFFAGKVNGYYLTISKGEEVYHVYITSDTVYKERVLASLKGKPIDLMVPNMGAAKQGTWIMTLTLNSKMLAKMISKLNPNMIIPVHYGTFEHYIEPVEKISNLKNEKIKILSVGDNIKLL